MSDYSGTAEGVREFANKFRLADRAFGNHYRLILEGKTGVVEGVTNLWEELGYIWEGNPRGPPEVRSER